MRNLHFAIGGDSPNCYPAHPTCSSVIGMVLAPRCLVHDSVIAPAQATEAYCQGDPSQPRSRGRSTSFADRNLVVNAERHGLHRLSFLLQHLAVSSQNKIVFDLSADLTVTTSRRNREFICGTRAYLKKHREGQCGGVERRTKIRGSRRKDNLNGLRFSPLLSGAISHNSSWSSAAFKV